MNLVKALRGELLDCNCCAHSRSECCCDTTWPEEVTRDAADTIERLQATIATLNESLSITSQGNARLTAELAECQNMQKVDQRVLEQLTETRDLAEHWAILAEQRRVELGECRKDAERYQVLCTCGFPTQPNKFGPMWWKDGELHYTLDAACDAKIAAMEAKP